MGPVKKDDNDYFQNSHVSFAFALPKITAPIIPQEPDPSKLSSRSKDCATKNRRRSANPRRRFWKPVL